MGREILDQLAFATCRDRNAIRLNAEGALELVGSWGRASWLEEAEVDEPCAAVELRVDGLDVELAINVRGLKNDDTGDLLWALGREPADDDGVTGVPEVEDLEWDRGLSALAGLELIAGSERGRAELSHY